MYIYIYTGGGAAARDGGGGCGSSSTGERGLKIFLEGAEMERAKIIVAKERIGDGF